MRRNHLPTVTMPSLRTNRPTDPANSGLFVLFQEISGSIRLGGGPGRTRTSNQTVMSGWSTTPSTSCTSMVSTRARRHWSSGSDSIEVRPGFSSDIGANTSRSLEAVGSSIVALKQSAVIGPSRARS